MFALRTVVMLVKYVGEGFSPTYRFFTNMHFSPTFFTNIITVCIKISDRGGGASLDECRRWTHYMYSTAPPPPKSDDAQIVPLAGYGYGIPLSRLYARYLGGDLMLQSIEGYGTDCFIYLKSGNNDAVEVLPKFTNQLDEHYKSKKEMKDWISKAGLISSNQLNTFIRNN